MRNKMGGSIRTDVEILSDLDRLRDKRGAISEEDYHLTWDRLWEELREHDRRRRELRRQAPRASDPCCPYKTLKAAYADGWHGERPEEYGGERVRLRGHTLVRNAEVAVSASEWGRRGYRVLPDQEPHGWLSGQVGNGRTSITWPVYRKDQVVAKRKVTARPPQVVDVLAAVWTVNRAAKRRRDAAQACYQGRAHGFAKAHKETKEEYYCLKSQALHYLLAEGRLRVVGYHVFPAGNWAEVLKGEGYTFHRPCPPQQGEAVQLDGIEAKPRGRAEPRVKDALHTLEMYLVGKPQAECYEWPAPVRLSRSRSRGPWWDELDDVDSWDEDWEADDEFDSRP
jgi:hypothetical protein